MCTTTAFYPLPPYITRSEQWRPISRGPDSSCPERFSNYPPGHEETTRAAFVFRVTYTATNEWSGIQPANRRRNWSGVIPIYGCLHHGSHGSRLAGRESVRKKAIRSRLSRRSRPISWTNRAINIQPEYQSGQPPTAIIFIGWGEECRERFSLGRREDGPCRWFRYR